jgi:ABC-type Fe3+-siderophore transport system permease subunit
MKSEIKQTWGAPKDRMALAFIGVSFILAGFLVLNYTIDSPVIDMIIIGISAGLGVSAVIYYRNGPKDNKWKPAKSNWRKEFK